MGIKGTASLFCTFLYNIRIYLIYFFNKNIVVTSQYALLQIIPVGFNHVIGNNVRRQPFLYHTSVFYNVRKVLSYILFAEYQINIFYMNVRKYPISKFDV